MDVNVGHRHGGEIKNSPQDLLASLSPIHLKKEDIATIFNKELRIYMQTNASLTKSKLSDVRQNYFHRGGFLIEDLDQGKNFHAFPRIPVLTIAVPFASYGI